MPSYVVHLSVANDIREKIKVNKNDFIFGNILPDVFNGYMVKDMKIEDHKKTHYVSVNKINNNTTSLPDYKLFLEKNELDNDVKLGYFVHILTDYYWNKYAIDKYGADVNVLKQHDFNLFNSYILLNKKLEKPIYDKDLILKSNGIMPVTKEELNMIINYLDEINNEIPKETEYQLFSEEELNKLYDNCLKFILDNLEEIGKTNNFKRVEIKVYVNEGIKNGTLVFSNVQKFQKITAIQGKVGEKVQTILADGTVETEPREVKLDEKTGNPGWIVQNITSPEKWIMSDSTFQKRYELDKETGLFSPNKRPMLAAELKENITFKPPMWGGDIINVKRGGYIMIDKNNPDDIYGIGKDEFQKTYMFMD